MSTKVIGHLNGRGTGTALYVTPYKAWNDEEGCVRFNLAPQDGPTSYATDKRIEFIATPNDVAKMLMVFRGMEETINDGKGINELGVLLKFSHVIDPIPGYRLELWEKYDVNSDTRHYEILLRTTEALELMLALEGVMSQLIFGM